VTRLTMMVTPDGQWVFPDTAEFLAALGDPNPDYDAVGFAVRNLGFIKFEQIEQSIIEIELHPRNVAFPALLAVQQQILSSQVTLFRIKYLDSSWRSEISSSAEHMIARLAELCAPKYTPPSSDRFTSELKDFATLFSDHENQWRPLAQKWRVSFGNFDPSVLSIAVKHQFLSRLVIAGMRPRDKEPVWRFIGDGHRWMGQRYQLFGIGEKVANMPDREYGDWVSEFYKSVALSGQPRLDLVNASLRYEDEAGKPRRLVSYERLLLPWKTPSDEVLITLCSRVSGAGAISAANPSSPSKSVRRNSESSLKMSAPDV